MRDAARRDVGLIGGSLERRLQHSSVPPLALPGVLAPFRRPGDEEALRRFVATPPLHVEIGFGRGHHLADLALLRPEARVLGFETRRSMVRLAARRAARLGADNVRLVEGDARPLIERLLPAGAAAAFHVLFPDPWWKKKHHKRRIFQAATIDLIHRSLAPGGALVTKTDVPAYADIIVEELLGDGRWHLVATSLSDPLLASLPRSHRELKCAEFGIPTFAFRFERP